MSQSVPKYLVGDVFMAKDGTIGIISKVNRNYSQPDPWHVSYAAEKIGNYPFSKNAWWSEDEFAEVLLGPTHLILSGEMTLKLTDAS